MGSHSSKSGLQEVTKKVAERAGKITVTGRYHRLPKKLEDDYQVEQKVLGSGYNGSVHLAKDKVNKRRFAVKEFKLHGVSGEKKEELETECEIFLSMDHPHVARLTDVYESEDNLSLVMECMEGGELFNRVTERKRFNEKDAVVAAYQMLLAVNYIHSHGVVHRDIKLENFLYEKKDSDHLKLIDFGFSKIWDPDTKMALSCGTLAYVAPEVLDKSYTSQCDLWSLGVVIFILLVGYMPFSGSEAHQVQMIKTAKYTIKKEPWAKVTQQASEFVAKLLVADPKKRMNADQALKHPWIAQRDSLVPHADIDKATADALIDFAQVSSFRRACMSVMAWSLTNEERARVREMFLEMDKNKKGTITLGEFKRVLEDKFHMDDDKVTEAFKSLDMNHSEEIHYSEFLAAMVSSRLKMHDDLLKQTFRRFDTDNSGYITEANLRDVLGDTFEGAEVDELMSEIKTRNDGKISCEEFIYYLKHPNASEKHQNAAHRVIDRHIEKQESETPTQKSSSRKMRLRTQELANTVKKKTKEKKAQLCKCVVL
mmetsp:Transcript_67753/g.124694  ORF Transcript_67753/g.124694 Transcript_67753/m.124694 type:complete len:540 (+) Transcript_67753:57-1676(+)